MAKDPEVAIVGAGAAGLAAARTLIDAGAELHDAVMITAITQGQASIAEQLLETGYRRGNWVLLQNCHHSCPVPPRLDQTMTI